MAYLITKTFGLENYRSRKSYTMNHRAQDLRQDSSYRSSGFSAQLSSAFCIPHVFENYSAVLSYLCILDLSFFKQLNQMRA